jgi:sortase A
VRRRVPLRAPLQAQAARASSPKQTVFKGAPEYLDVRLLVPSIYLDARLTSGIEDTPLRFGPGHDKLSDAPGAPGNCVVAAHRNVWGAEFWHLPSVKKGALIELRTPTKRLFYRVISARTIQGDDLSPLQPPQDPKASRLTLYTCTKPRTAARFLVSADLEKTEPSSLALFNDAALPFAKTTVAQAP